MLSLSSGIVVFEETELLREEKLLKVSIEQHRITNSLHRKVDMIIGRHLMRKVSLINTDG
jgi:hypothetical protein